ncbi:MAG: hypothetical protein GY724_09260 [Actinomycetia bacterium]|nr:hypothetical protein [Actinomycetes bacterium]
MRDCKVSTARADYIDIECSSCGGEARFDSPVSLNTLVYWWFHDHDCAVDTETLFGFEVKTIRPVVEGDDSFVIRLNRPEGAEPVGVWLDEAADYKLGSWDTTWLDEVVKTPDPEPEDG